MSLEHNRAQSGLPEDRPVPKPEDFIGTTMNDDGTERRIDGIEAIGSKYVVFRLRNLATNVVDRVAKVPKEDFDPRQPLLEALPIALKDLPHSADRVIRICERLLQLDPTIEAAAFNLGVARYATEDTAGALEAFERALSLAPGDVWNLLHRASCLALLGRDEECLRDFFTAKTVPGDNVRVALSRIRPHALNIRMALGRLSQDRQTGRMAMEVLEDYF